MSEQNRIEGDGAPSYKNKSLPIVTLIFIVSLLPVIPLFACVGRFWMFDQKFLFVLLFSILVGLFTVRLMVRLLW